MIEQKYINRVREWLAAVTYKPGWRFEFAELVDPLGPPARVLVEYVAVDSRTGELGVIRASLAVPRQSFLPDPVRGDFNRWLRGEVHRIECHESDEWFRIDGDLVFDPHQRQRTLRG